MKNSRLFSLFFLSLSMNSYALDGSCQGGTENKPLKRSHEQFEYSDLNQDGVVDADERIKARERRRKRAEQFIQDAVPQYIPEKSQSPKLPLQIPQLTPQQARNPRQNLRLYESLYKQERYTDALVVLKRYEKIAGSNHWFEFQIGVTLLKLGKYKESIEHLSKALEFKRSAPVLFQRGVAYFKLGHYEEAIDDLSTCIVLDPQHGTSYFYRGLAFKRLSDYDKAALDEQMTVHLIPKFKDLYESIDNATVASKEPEQIKNSDYSSGQANDDQKLTGAEHAELSADVSEIPDSAHKPNAATQAPRTIKLPVPLTAVSKSNSTAAKHNSKGTITRSPKKTSTTASTSAIKSSANKPAAASTSTPSTKIAAASSGAITEASNRASNQSFAKQNQAIKTFTKLIEMNPEDADTRYNRGLAYLMIGKFAEAAADFKVFLTATDYKGTASLYASALCSLAYEAAHLPAQEKEILAAASSKCAHTWPFPIIEYLTHKMPYTELLENAKTKYAQTTAHTYLAMSLLSNGDKAKATENLQWVKDNGDRRMDDFRLAQSLLEHLK